LFSFTAGVVYGVRPNSNSAISPYICTAQQNVWVLNRAQTRKAVIEQVLNETSAIVSIADPYGADDKHIITTDWKITGKKDNESTRCTGFKFARQKIGIAVIADKRFQMVYSLHIKVLGCYAKVRGYDFLLLSGMEFPNCFHHFDFFFKKHCMVAEFLKKQPADYALFVVDADVLPVVTERGLEQWLHGGEDIALYERASGEEVAAGNYIARNTQFTRDFLKGWADFEHLVPKGFSSADNGALHVHLLQFLNLRGANKCRQIYDAMVSLDAAGPEYWNFVNCTKLALGLPRRWLHPSRKGSVAIWPRLNFFVDDGAYMNFNASNFLGPVMHHGIKEPERVKAMYLTGEDSNATCGLKTERLESALQFGLQLLLTARAYAHLYPQGRACKQCIERCMRTVSCYPLEFGEEDKADP